MALQLSTTVIHGGPSLLLKGYLQGDSYPFIHFLMNSILKSPSPVL